MGRISSERMTGMKFVTFNLRCDHQQDGINCFIYRQPLILRAIQEKTPDVICFQEVLPHMAAWLKKSLTDYYVIGCGRGEKLDSEQMTVAFRKDGYQLLEMRTFWLSETPLIPGSRYPGQSSCPRTCTEAVLMEEASGQVFRVFNAHLDHVGKEARQRGLEQILRRVEAVELFPDAPMILAGDFNAEPDSEEMRPLRTFPGLRNITGQIGFTYHGYMAAQRPMQIDYILLRGPVACSNVEKWTQCENGVFLSDHYPVCAELNWEAK